MSAALMSAGVSTLPQPELLLLSGISIDDIGRLLNLKEIDLLLLLACLPLQVVVCGLGNFGLALHQLFAGRLYQHLVQPRRILHEPFSLTNIRIIYQELTEIRPFGRFINYQLNIPVFHFCRPPSKALPHSPLSGGILCVNKWSCFSIISVPSAAKALGSKHYNDDRPGQVRVLRDDLRSAEPRSNSLPNRQPLHKDPAQITTENVRNLTRRNETGSNPSSSLPYRPRLQLSDPPRKPPFPSPSAPAPPEACLPAVEEAPAASLTLAARPSAVSSELLQNSTDRSDIRRECLATHYDRVDSTDSEIDAQRLDTSSPVENTPAPSQDDDGVRHSSDLAALSPQRCAVIVTTPGDTSKGKAPDRSTPQPSANTSKPSRKRPAGKQEAGRTRGNDSDGEQEDEQGEEESDDGAQADRDVKRRRTLAFRCPKYAADPEGCENERCETWETYEIANVTRHAKGHARGDNQKLKEIENLSKSKLTPIERWKKYCHIFMGGREGDQANQPFHVKMAPNDMMQAVFKFLNTHVNSKTVGDQRQYTAWIEKIERFNSEKDQEIRRIVRKQKQISIQLQKSVDVAISRAEERFLEKLADLDGKLQRNELLEPDVQQQRQGMSMDNSSIQQSEDNVLHTTGGAATGQLHDEEDGAVGDALTGSSGLNSDPLVVPEAAPVFLERTRSRGIDLNRQTRQETMAHFIKDQEGPFAAELERPGQGAMYPGEGQLLPPGCRIPPAQQQPSDPDSGYQSFMASSFSGAISAYASEPHIPPSSMPGPSDTSMEDVGTYLLSDEYDPVSDFMDMTQLRDVD